MADENYYSLKETAEKLEKTEVEVRQLAKDGKLKEQFTGEEVFYLVAEVDLLAADTSETIALTSEDTAVETQEPAPEEATGEIELQLEDTAGQTQAKPLEEETSETKDDTVGLSADEDEISLAPELDETIATDDTRLDGEGINVLTETDTAGFDITHDTMAETSLPEDEESLEKIEEDVNLDSFGSGSGLLDLSLQADDTSLGGVLDEIYAGEDEEALPAGSAIDIATGTGLMPDEDFGETEPAAAGVAMPMYAEPSPDTSSNLFGIMLLIPFAAVIFMAIAIVSAYSGTKPGLLAAVEGKILIVIGAAAVLAIVVMLAALFMGGEKSAKPKKEKAKKAKKAKPKKKKGKKKKGAPEAEETDEAIEEDIAE